MNTTELKIYLKSNPTSKSKLNNKCTKLYNSLFTNISIIAKGEREREREREENEPQPAQSATFNYDKEYKIIKYKNIKTKT